MQIAVFQLFQLAWCFLKDLERYLSVCVSLALAMMIGQRAFKNVLCLSLNCSEDFQNENRACQI
jgi:hypothetical protein